MPNFNRRIASARKSGASQAVNAGAQVSGFFQMMRRSSHTALSPDGNPRAAESNALASDVIGPR